MAKNLRKCKSGKDFIQYAERNGLEVKPGNGSHMKVYSEDGMMVVPVHSNKQLGTGLRTKILKFLAVAVTIIVIGAVLLN